MGKRKAGSRSIRKTTSRRRRTTIPPKKEFARRQVGKWYGGKRITGKRARGTSAGSGGPYLLMLPGVAAQTTGRTPIEYTNNYFRHRFSAPFMSPLAVDFDFVLETPLTTRVPSRDRYEVAAAVENSLHDLALYLSNFLTHPRYGPEKEVGFVRGGTVRPTNLKEISPGQYGFGAVGIVVGQPDLFRFIDGRLRDKQATPVPAPKIEGGWLHFGINMPARPDAREVGGEEWYSFTPTSWHRNHKKKVGEILGLTLRIRPRREHPMITPQYHRLYKNETVRIALLFGYDEFYASHNFGHDARAIERIVTAPPSKRFSAKDTGPYGYHGPGLGFSKVGGDKLSVSTTRGPLVYVRDAEHGGQVRVTDPTDRSIHHINVEIRVYDFDHASRWASQKLVDKFVAPFGDNDIIHYDGHANYGGGFYVGNRNNDILWAVDVGSYRRRFSPKYQIFSIGACHSAGYFADLFYNELKPRKTPSNLDVVAGVNEEAMTDAVHTAVDLIANLLQIDEPVMGQALDYEQLLLEINKPTSFRSDIGVFGHPQHVLKQRLVWSTDKRVPAKSLHKPIAEILATPGIRRSPAVLAPTH